MSASPSWRPRLERNVGHNPVTMPGLVYLHGPNGGDQGDESWNEVRFVRPEWLGRTRKQEGRD